MAGDSIGRETGALDSQRYPAPMRPWLLRLAAIALLLGLPPAMRTESAHACSCAELPGVWESVEEATAVFAGRVEALEGWESGDDYGVHVTFAVSRVWKGPASAELVANTRSLGAGDCGAPLRLGEEYLVYAYDETLDIWLCTRTLPLAYAEEDLATLGEGHAPVPGATGDVEAVVRPPPGAPNVGSGAIASQEAGNDAHWWLLAAVTVALAGTGVVFVRRRLR